MYKSYFSILEIAYVLKLIFVTRDGKGCCLLLPFLWVFKNYDMNEINCLALVMHLRPMHDRCCQRLGWGLNAESSQNQNEDQINPIKTHNTQTNITLGKNTLPGTGLTRARIRKHMHICKLALSIRTPVLCIRVVCTVLFKETSNLKFFQENLNYCKYISREL